MRSLRETEEAISAILGKPYKINDRPCMHPYRFDLQRTDGYIAQDVVSLRIDLCRLKGTLDRMELRV